MADDVLEQEQRDAARIPFPNSNSSTAALTLLQRCTNKSLPRIRAQHCQEQAWGQQKAEEQRLGQESWKQEQELTGQGCLRGPARGF